MAAASHLIDGCGDDKKALGIEAAKGIATHFQAQPSLEAAPGPDWLLTLPETTLIAGGLFLVLA